MDLTCQEKVGESSVSVIMAMKSKTAQEDKSINYNDNCFAEPETDRLEEHEDLLQISLSPLNIPSIVRNVLHFVQFKELIVCRQVCRLWTEEGTKLLETRAKISIYPLINLYHFINLVKDVTEQHYSNGRLVISPRMSIGSLKKFNIKLQTDLDGGKHVDKLFKILGSRIVSTEMSMEIGSQSTIWKILQKYGVQLSCITITDAYCNLPQRAVIEIMRYVAHVPFFLSRAVLLPSVKELRLFQTLEPAVELDEDNNPVDLPLHPSNSYDVIQKLAVCLLPLLLNLEVLHINNQRGDYSCFVTEIAATTHEFANKCPALSKVDFPLNLNEAEVIAIHEKYKWPLESLTVSLRPGLRFQALYSWLSFLGPTLTYLDLDFVLIPPNPETFPCGYDLVNIKTLKLKNYYGPLDFLPYMTTLQSLSLTNVNLSVAFRNEPERSCGQMTALEIISGHSNAGRMSFAHIYNNITKFFPRLRKFRGNYLSDSNLKIVIKQCPLIEELLLADSVITDEGITGIPFARCHELQLMLDRTDSTKLSLVEDNGLIKETCIADLKCLKRLHINSPRISNVSIFYGLTNCGNLDELCMSSPLITSQILLQFMKKVNLKRLHLFLSRSYRIRRDDVALLLLPKPENQESSWPTMILDGKCDACGVSETD